MFVGVSAPNLLSKDMVRSMNRDAIVFAMANPTPEIMPEDALEAGAAIVGTGRSDYPNQINNVLVFPGLFKGALRAKSKKITEEMKENLLKATKWIKFINIVGCISMGFLAIVGFIAIFWGFMDGYRGTGSSIPMGIIYIILAAIYYPVLKMNFFFHQSSSFSLQV